jgi:hypothetical protein
MGPPPVPIPDVLKGIDDLIRTELEAFRQLWFDRLLMATGAVVIGLVAEGPELWHEITSIVGHWRFNRRFHFSLPEKRTADWAKLLAFVGWIFIVAGVAGEFVADSFLSKADGYVQKFDEILLADAQRQTTLANVRSSSAYERAAQTEKEAAEDLKATNIARQKAEEARQRSEGFRAQMEKDEMEAAQLKKTTEDERLARAKIEAAVAFRQLSERQKQEIGGAVKDFSTEAVASVWFNSSTTEAELFADDISEALQFGHIRVQPASGFMEMRENSKFGDPVKRAPTGVVIQSTKHEGARKFAEVMVAELSRIGFDAVRQTDPPFDDKPVPQIWINVEPRPKGPQGEYKLQAEQEAKAKNTAKSK